MRDPDDRAQLLEVKTMPAWGALLRVSDLDVTQGIVDGSWRCWRGIVGVREVLG